MELLLFDSSSPDYIQQLTRAVDMLRRRDQDSVFPLHFLQTTLPRIGGYLVICRDGKQTAGVGFLFPRLSGPTPDCGDRDTSSFQRAFTLRYQSLSAATDIAYSAAQIGTELSRRLPATHVEPFDPAGDHPFEATHQQFGEVDIGRPDCQEAAQIRQLQADIWGSPPQFLYPTDIHSTDFALGTSLVARVKNRLAGFLFGFYSYSKDILPNLWQDNYGGEIRIESQAMGVLPQYRGMRIGNLLKRVQATEAWQKRIGIVQWTADPLQYPNAALNFGLLRATAYTFYTDYYPFRNQLNRVPASRLGIVWLVGSKRVREVPKIGSRAAIFDLLRHPAVRRLDHDPSHLLLEAQEPMIAFEIPQNWTELQSIDIEGAVRWRTATDQLFAHYLGHSTGKYMIMGVGRLDTRCYLLAERADHQLWTRLGAA